MEAYTQAKLNLLRHVSPLATIILNQLSTTSNQLPATSHQSTILFSKDETLTQGAWRSGDQLFYNGEVICDEHEVRLLGEHNIENLLAAAAISGAVGATSEAMGIVARSFTGVPHRLEVVSNKDGVTWINDSIATSPERAIAGLRSFTQEEQMLILLAGGKDKNLPWQAFADETLARVNYLIAFGHAGPMIVNEVQERAKLIRHMPPNCAVVQRLDEAVHLASKVAYQDSIVLLSPGGTSFDAYRDFEARGQHFRELVLSC